MAHVRFVLFLLSLTAAACHATTVPSTRPTMPASVDRQAWLDQFARGYFPGRSGQIFLVPREGDFVVDRDPLYAFMHGSPWNYAPRSAAYTEDDVRRAQSRLPRRAQ